LGCRREEATGMATTLSGPSVVFVRVKAGNVDRAMREIRRNKAVERVEPLLGPHDLVLTGTFKDFETLRKYSENLEAQEFCEGTVVYPTFEQWRREGKPEQPWNAWALVKTDDIEAAKGELKRISAVNRYYTTAGEYGLIVQLSAENPSELQEAVMEELQKVEGVRRTETFPSIRAEE